MFSRLYSFFITYAKKFLLVIVLLFGRPIASLENRQLVKESLHVIVLSAFMIDQVI